METRFFSSGFERNAYVIMAFLLVALVMPPIRTFFSDIGLRWLYIFMLAMSLSYALTPIFRWIALRVGILDTPDARKIHDNATPLLGGAAVFLGFGFSILSNDVYSQTLEVILFASLILFIAGVLDDSWEMPAWIKLLVQLACTVWVIHHGVVLRVFPTEMGLFSEWGNAILTVLWIVGITNAMNFFDGMDGLAAGLGAIIAFFLGVVAFQTNQPFLGWVAVAAMGSCLGFLPFNFRLRDRATIFLGDAGSTVIGFVLACIAVYGDWAEHNPIGALVSPVLIFWILIFDMVHITIDRIQTGKVRSFREWIDYVGKDHLHHRLAYALGGPKRSVMFIFLLSFCLGSSAVVLRDARTIDAVVLLLQATILVVLITILERRGRIIGASEALDNMTDGPPPRAPARFRRCVETGGDDRRKGESSVMGGTDASSLTGASGQKSRRSPAPTRARENAGNRIGFQRFNPNILRLILS